MTASQNLKVNWKTVPTRTITAGGVEFAYREFGTNNPGTPVVFLIHLAAVLDNWGPRVQEIVLMEPQLVRKMIIAGTGPAGGEGISKVDLKSLELPEQLRTSSRGKAAASSRHVHQPVASVVPEDQRVECLRSRPR